MSTPAGRAPRQFWNGSAPRAWEAARGAGMPLALAGMVVLVGAAAPASSADAPWR
ncbi:hypothetical protein [Streptomyces sp. NPDC002067]